MCYEIAQRPCVKGLGQKKFFIRDLCQGSEKIVANFVHAHDHLLNRLWLAVGSGCRLLDTECSSLQLFHEVQTIERVLRISDMP